MLLLYFLDYLFSLSMSPLSLSLSLSSSFILPAFSFYRGDVPVETTTMLEKTGLLQAPALERRILVVSE